MSDMDKDVDVVMDKETNAERNIKAHIEHVGREIVTRTNVSFEELKNNLLDVHNQLQMIRPLFQSQFNDSTLGRPHPSEPRSDPAILRLNTENEQLKEQLQISDAKRASLDQKVEEREKQINELELSLQIRRTELKRLNTIIIKGGAPNVGPSDDQIRAEFCDVRDRILKIARGHYQATNVQLPRKESTTKAERQHRWMSNWSRDSTEIRNYRIQGAIFDLIYWLIFSRPLFGVEKELERRLGDFETNMMNCREISQVDKVEWRKRTVAAAKSFDSRSTHLTVLADRTAEKIEETLEPALTQLSSRPKAEQRARNEQLTKEVRTLCDKALELSLELRSSRAIFKVVMLEHGRSIDVNAEDTELDLVAVIGKINPSIPLIQVAFTVSAGLEKTTLIPGDSEETVTLQKAQVVGVR